MLGRILNALQPSRRARKRWLTDRDSAHHERLQTLVPTGVENIENRIALMRDSKTQQYWIKHLIDKGEHFWFEYQPITDSEAESLRRNPNGFRQFALHDWVADTTT